MGAHVALQKKLLLKGFVANGAAVAEIVAMAVLVVL